MATPKSGKPKPKSATGKTMQAKKKSILHIYGERRTYLNILYLLLLFPLGVISFVAAITLIAISLTLVAAPFLVPFGQVDFGSFVITSLPLKLLVGLLLLAIGLVLLTGSLYLMNALAIVYKKLLGLFE